MKTYPGLTEEETQQLNALVAKIDIPMQVIEVLMDSNDIGTISFEGGIASIEALQLAKWALAHNV